LAPLRKLVGRVRWVLREVAASDEIKERMRDFISVLNGTTL
jgi:hypothetical protein